MKSGSSVRGKVTYFFRSVRPFLITGLIVALITSIQWLPTLQFIAHSARQADQMDWHVEGWFLPWQHLIQFIAPDFFGNPSTLNYWGVWNYGELVGYVGIVPLVMALYAIIFRRDKKTAFFATLFFVSLLFSLPTLFAKLPFLLSLPFLSTAQPTRLLSVTTFSLAALAGLGVDLYMKKKRAIFYPLFIVAVCLGSLWVIATFFYGLFGISPDNALTARSNLKLPSILFAAVLVLLSVDILSKKKLLRQGVLAVLLLIASFDLVRFGWKFTPFTNREYLYPSTKMTSFLMSDHSLFRVMATDSRLFPPNFSSIYKIDSVDLYDPLYLVRYGELIAAMERNGPNITPPFGFNRIITPHAISSPIVNLLNVKYVLSFNDISSDRFKKLGQEGSTLIFENKDVLPRAFFATNIVPAVGDQDAIGKLFQNAKDFKSVAVVEGWNPSKNRTFSQGNISDIIYKENSVTIKVESKDEAFLVLLDADYPSWKAAIQTENSTVKAPIYRTDFAFRGVVVPKGLHTIVFSIGII